MKKFKDLVFYKKVTLVYFYSFLCSLFFSPLFGKLFIIIFHPSMSGGMFPTINDSLQLIGGTMLGILTFLSFFSSFLLEKKKFIVWIFGFILPFFLISTSLKEAAWAFLLSAIGWGLAKIILLYKSKKPNSK